MVFKNLRQNSFRIKIKLKLSSNLIFHLNFFTFKKLFFIIVNINRIMTNFFENFLTFSNK